MREYWIVDRRQRSVTVYRRDQAALRLASTPYESDTLDSPLLPGFGVDVSRLLASVS